MKIVILLLFLGMIMPVFAQESPLENVSNQLENQINQNNLKELENTTADIENKIDQVITKIDVLQNQNVEFNQRLHSIENQPSFDDQFVSSTEYTKLMDRLYAIETKIENNNSEEFQSWIIVIGNLATVGALIFVGYETMMSRNERRNTLRAWINQTGSIQARKYIDEKGISYQKDEYEHKSDDEKKNIVIGIVEWMMHLKNSGKLPALVKGRIKIVIGRIPKRNEILGEYSPPFVIMPDQEHMYVSKISPQDHNALISDDKLAFVIFDFSYTSEGSKKERRYGFIGSFTSGTYIIIDTWNEKTFNEKDTFDLEEYLEKIKKEPHDSKHKQHSS